MISSVSKAYETLCEILDLLTGTEAPHVSAFREKLLSAWPSVKRLDLEFLNNLCRPVDDYLAKYVGPMQSEKVPYEPRKELSKSAAQFCMFSSQTSCLRAALIDSLTSAQLSGLALSFA